MIGTRITTSSSVALLLSTVLFDGVRGQAPTVYNTTQGLTGFLPCDALIAANLSHAVHLPSSPLYASLVANGSWGIDTRKQPYCFVLPSTTSEVSRALTSLRGAGDGAGDWHVAIRSGGHGSDNSNNIATGVTIDLTQLNATTYDAATNTASIGTGARWLSVYEELAKDGVTMAGGRQGIVGVGGLLLGGGISWYTGRRGFACDNVVNYEIVLASGEVLNANASANSDLWLALKGGSSNFGIVTRFDVEAFPVKNLSLETRTFSEENANEIADAIAAFTDLDQSFADDVMLTILSYNPETGNSSITVTEINTMDISNSTAFDAFNSISTSTPVTTQSLTLADSSSQGNPLSGTALNAGTGSLTITNDPRVLRYCFAQHASLIADLKSSIGPQSFSTIMDFQPFPSYYANISTAKGGNMLGLERDMRNKVLVALGVSLLGADSRQQYPLVLQKVTATNERIVAFARSLGSDQEFVYLPYADARQDPIGSYGAANVQRIRDAANKYDPSGFFQRRVPGGFKISRVDRNGHVLRMQLN
ncbi:FAD binding domain-containing protein [Pestalotiopsis sp. NC0098]|nr:FAD binding domain-containing protein [Pestalotiopsis sp. NC0098]